MSFEKQKNKTKQNRTSLPPLQYILCMRQFDPLLRITCFCFTANKCLNKAKVHPRMSIKSVSTLFGSPLFIIACKLAVHKQNYYFWSFLFTILKSNEKKDTDIMYMLWFNFILGLNFNFFCFWVRKCMIMSLKQKKRKFKPRIKLNYNIYSLKSKLWQCFIRIILFWRIMRK